MIVNFIYIIYEWSIILICFSIIDEHYLIFRFLTIFFDIIQILQKFDINVQKYKLFENISIIAF